ncbi:hypothetical protein Tsubulata_044581 [Turnera subulata]|uniref:Pentatricopeptide repeat-containing protein n=1 Tax=Turnera subulata TaxID=218843 RepID=A0A9Q0FCN2_9ROSI|nr:hypothetical protein Tsubulata_044581 [Turnera subulata]
MLSPRSFPFRLISRHHSTSRPIKSTLNLADSTATFRHRPKKFRISLLLLLERCKSMTHPKQIQAQMFLVGLHQNTDVLSKLTAFCTHPSNGDLVYAGRIFGWIQNPGLFIYNLLIKAFAKNGSFMKCFSFFTKLRVDGLWPDNFTYPFVFKAIGCLGEVSEGEKVHGFVVKSGDQFDTYVCNSLMDMYARLGRIGISRKLFDEMLERDVVLWNVLISGYLKCGRFQDAFCSCAALKSLGIGKELHRYAREELDLTSVIYNALVDMYCKYGCLSVALEIVEQMPCKTVIFWTSMVSEYVNCGELDKARELFDKNPVKDIVLWTAMINGLEL